MSNQKETYAITGMSCAACQSRVEKAVNGLEQVEQATVNLLTNSMTVEGSASEREIIAAVEKAGYKAKRMGAGVDSVFSGSAMSQQESMLEDRQTPKMLRRLASSIVVLLFLMYFSMGHMMFGWPLPAFFADNHLSQAMVQMILSAIVMMINRRFFISGFQAVLHGGSNMDTLVALGSAASYGWSLLATFMMSDAMMRGDMASMHHWMDNLYYEGAAMILTLITLGKTLESYSKGRTTDALKSLMQLAPKEATLLREGAHGQSEELTVPVDQVKKGDIFLVRPGQSIPVDGIVLEGNSAVDESALTGESIPVDKAKGDSVSAATMNRSGFLKAKATRVGADTTLSQIIQMVSDASASKAPIAKVADRISGIFVPVVLAIALVTLLIWLFVGADAGYALSRAIAVLVISCPCALGLATPVAIMVGNGRAAKMGLLFKNATALEEAGRSQIIALDKTGTITKGEPEVTDLLPAQKVSEEELLELAYSMEKMSEHPLARAIVSYGDDKQMKAMDCQEFTILPGNGIKAKIEGQYLKAGSLSYMQGQIDLAQSMRQKAEDLAKQGKTPLFFAQEGRLLGMIAVADVIKEDSPTAIRELKEMGIRVVMLTGDNPKTAQAIAAQAGVDHMIAGVLPDGKERVIRSLQTLGKTAMVGDGINDAPALTRADMGIAIGAGTDVAIDAADLVLVHSKLSDVVRAIRLSRATLRNIHENLFWAFFYNVLGIPLAAGAYVAMLGLSLNPMFAAAAMAFSSVFVVGNALRLNFFRAESKITASKRHEVSQSALTELIEREFADKSQDQQRMHMTKTIRIEGMMCEHCEMTVKKALEALDGIESASVSHSKGSAVIEESKAVPEADIKAAIEGKDYKFISVE